MGLLKTDYDAKIIDHEGKIPSVAGRATTVILNVDKNKIPNVSDLVKKKDYDEKIWDFESRYFGTSGYNKFRSEIPDAKSRETGVNW